MRFDRRRVRRQHGRPSTLARHIRRPGRSRLLGKVLRIVQSMRGWRKTTFLKFIRLIPCRLCFLSWSQVVHTPLASKFLLHMALVFLGFRGPMVISSRLVLPQQPPLRSRWEKIRLYTWCYMLAGWEGTGFLAVALFEGEKGEHFNSWPFDVEGLAIDELRTSPGPWILAQTQSFWTNRFCFYRAPAAHGVIKAGKWIGQCWLIIWGPMR